MIPPTPRTSLRLWPWLPALLLLLALGWTAPAVAEAAPEVTVAQGKMVGATETSRSGRTIYSFRGIPYAAPPLEQLRFQAPREPKPWAGVLNATSDGSECVQKNYLLPPYPVTGSEDCLFLNVFTPTLSALNSSLPVMVYIYGGGFFAGSNSVLILGASFLLDQDVVLVTMNYRLGALGFLSTGDTEAQGNAGFKDQVMALRWVKRNIGAFGGDASTVTLFGQSAGSVSVHMHLFSKMSAGLFHRAITQSGTVLSPWARPEDPWPTAKRQAEMFNCSTHTTAAAVRCLQEVDARQLTETSHEFHYWSIDPLVVFRPVVEKGPDPFLDEDPLASMLLGRFSQVPWMNGVVVNEGAVRTIPILTNEELTKSLNGRFNELMPLLLELDKSVPEEAVPAVWRNISQYYFHTDQGYVNETTSQSFMDLFSDRAFLHGFLKSAMLHAHYGHKNQFLYQFKYRGLASYSILYGGNFTDYGVCHCDDLIYLFHSPALFPHMAAADGPDIQVSRELVILWTNFAKYGNPTPSHPKTPGPNGTDAESQSQQSPANSTELQQSCSNLDNFVWEPYSPVGGKYDLKLVEISRYPVENNSSQILQYCMREGFNKERMDFWNSLPLSENREISLDQILYPIFVLLGVFF